MNYLNRPADVKPVEVKKPVKKFKGNTPETAITYRVALMRNENGVFYTTVVSCLDVESVMESSLNFVRWEPRVPVCV